MTPRILIIAGSDSGGGAGIQADIKTVTMLGGHAMTAVTAITAQNTLGVQAVMPVPTDMVMAQIESVASDIGIDAVKIGMIGSAATAHAVADWLERTFSPPWKGGGGGGSVLRGTVASLNTHPQPLPSREGSAFRTGSPSAVPVVFDPVMVATSGDILADDATTAAFARLMRLATVVTPNLPELSALAGMPVDTADAVFDAAQTLAHRRRCAVLAKGGHGRGGELVDRLAHPDPIDGPPAAWRADRIDSTSTHGTGCTLASAIATFVATGWPLAEAIAQARTFVRLAIKGASGLGSGHGPMGQQTVRLDLSTELGARLNQATLPLVDWHASLSFYGMLGLRPIVTTPPRYARFESDGGVTLSIEAADEIDGRPLLYLECADLDAIVDRLRAAGHAVADPVLQSWGWREARLADPAGNALCLYQAGENRRFPAWRRPDA